ncbi:MAG: hypothetical protein QF362_02860 [Candidatus Woesearchaeota archaeon]|jgi:hypothetical protein|nr:hypothetical protein [Candidatus Woesearchaeota archaeon]MDP7610707.1 hypothetical protein [Candidatus Woesearchaeota archaeon]|tara:strand:+ start:204 stop:347 length:144 start_codon:yes stop_codon:yes gene_type:complete
MPEIRFSITSKLNKIVVDISNSMGVDKSDYIKSLILTDIREKNIKKK